MNLGTSDLLDFYVARQGDDCLVLATIVATEGSTYRKPGAMMLIARDGSFEGLISGGCLEGDLLHHAADVFSSGAPKRVTYNLHADDELVWSLGLGCDGVIHLLLQRLDRDRQFGFLPQLERSHRSRLGVLLALATQLDAALPAGTHALRDSNDISEGDAQLSRLLEKEAQPWPAWRYRAARLGAEPSTEVLMIHVPATPRVLICGAGPDAVPLARALRELAWDVVVADHRPAFARPERFPPGCSVVQTRPEQLGEAIDVTALDAAVIMSHHLENDGAYLRNLAPHDLPYVGLLGPRARRGRLAEMAGCPERALHGPVGLDIGAELPAAIALAVAAEIHAVLNGRDGASLTRKDA